MVPIKSHHQETLISIIHRHAPRCTIILFGSYARNDQTSSSDIDIALDAGQTIPYTKIISILQDIDETTIPFKIDIVDMHSVQESVKKNILKEGIIWWKN